MVAEAQHSGTIRKVHFVNQGMSRSLLNIEKRTPPRLALRSVGWFEEPQFWHYNNHPERNPFRLGRIQRG